MLYVPDSILWLTLYLVSLGWAQQIRINAATCSTSSIYESMYANCIVKSESESELSSHIILTLVYNNIYLKRHVFPNPRMLQCFLGCKSLLWVSPQQALHKVHSIITLVHPSIREM